MKCGKNLFLKGLKGSHFEGIHCLVTLAIEELK